MLYIHKLLWIIKHSSSFCTIGKCMHRPRFVIRFCFLQDVCKQKVLIFSHYKTKSVLSNILKSERIPSSFLCCVWSQFSAIFSYYQLNIRWRLTLRWSRMIILSMEMYRWVKKTESSWQSLILCTKLVSIFTIVTCEWPVASQAQATPAVDRHDWKHYVSATSLSGGKNNILQVFEKNNVTCNEGKR